MTVRVLFFASLREAAGTSGIDLVLGEPVGLDELMRRLSERLTPDAMAALGAENVRVSINQTLTGGGREDAGGIRISPGDEVAFLPPVTGG